MTSARSGRRRLRLAFRTHRRGPRRTRRADGADRALDAAAGGTDDGRIGTSFDRVTAAIAEADPVRGVVVLCDLGSAILTAETALDFLDDEQRDRVRIVDAPLVEGGVAASVAAEVGRRRSTRSCGPRSRRADRRRRAAEAWKRVRPHRVGGAAHPRRTRAPDHAQRTPTDCTHDRPPSS